MGWEGYMLLQSQGFYCVIKDLCIWVMSVIFMDVEVPSNKDVFEG